MKEKYAKNLKDILATNISKKYTNYKKKAIKGYSFMGIDANEIYNTYFIGAHTFETHGGNFNSIKSLTDFKSQKTGKMNSSNSKLFL